MTLSDYGWSPTLGKLLEWLDCPHDRLHNRGNDAHFTLRAIILLAIDEIAASEETSVRERLLEHAAMSAIPCNAPNEDKYRELLEKYAATVKTSRYQWVPCLGHRAVLRDEKAEKELAKEEIQAERAAKRLAQEESSLYIIMT